MIDERILTFLHENNLELAGMRLCHQSNRVTVTLKKYGGGLAIGRAEKSVHGAEEDLLSAFRAAIAELRLAEELEVCLGLKSPKEDRV
jgi:hypothetical protein